MQTVLNGTIRLTVSPSVYFSQSCRLRGSLQQQGRGHAASHQVTESHHISQNAAAEGSARGSAPDYHQTHQETERQGR